MSLDITLSAVRRVPVYDANITHNLAKMADEAGIYDLLWRPDEMGDPLARDLVTPLRVAIEDMEARPAYYKQFDAPNGWGAYEDFLPWLRDLLDACEAYPDAEVGVWR